MDNLKKLFITMGLLFTILASQGQVSLGDSLSELINTLEEDSIYFTQNQHGMLVANFNFGTLLYIHNDTIIQECMYRPIDEKMILTLILKYDEQLTIMEDKTWSMDSGTSFVKLLHHKNDEEEYDYFYFYMDRPLHEIE